MQAQCLCNNPKEKTVFPFYSVTRTNVLSTSSQQTAMLPDFLIFLPTISLNRSFFPICIKHPHVTVELEDVGLSVYRLLVDQYIKLTACQNLSFLPSQPAERK